MGVEVKLPGVESDVVSPAVDAVFSCLRGFFHSKGVCGETSSGLGVLGDGGSSQNGVSDTPNR